MQTIPSDWKLRTFSRKKRSPLGIFNAILQDSHYLQIFFVNNNIKILISKMFF